MSAALACLALTVYFEARGEPLDAQVAVAQTVMNRVEDYRFPDTVCEVVTQGGEGNLHQCQFSWYCDGKSDTPREIEAWANAEQVAQMVLIAGHRIPALEQALFYHANYVTPYWAEKFLFLEQRGRHKFYAGERIDNDI